ncbi:pseudouridine synthase [Anatilimnocola sp. NA78]|uniref:RluA family pseudouridine synthase n=1 Tax=Anatilimnocola sp. NA78 TaxID=3415683 RepID=UPI003CE4B86E
MPVATARFTAHSLAKPTRLDATLKKQYPGWGRQAVQRLIGSGKVRLNGRVVKLSSWEVNNGDRLEILDPPADKVAAPIAWDDAWLIADEPDLVAVNKPAGLLSEAPRFSPTGNLLDLAKARFGPVILFHRLDRDTSGVVILTRPGPVNKYLDAAFKSHSVRKEYLAVVTQPNQLDASGTIDAYLGPHPQRRDQMAVVTRGGQKAVTNYQIEVTDKQRQLVRLFPQTGRTHQLRVHLAHLGAPILGDRLYGPQPPKHPRLLLHAEQIHLPSAEGYPERTFTAELPRGFWPLTPSF